MLSVQDLELVAEALYLGVKYRVVMWSIQSALMITTAYKALYPIEHPYKIRGTMSH